MKPSNEEAASKFAQVLLEHNELFYTIVYENCKEKRRKALLEYTSKVIELAGIKDVKKEKD
jgi:hypothetical protein